MEQDAVRKTCPLNFDGVRTDSLEFGKPRQS